MVMPLVAFALWTGVILLATLLPIPEATISAIGFEYTDKLVHYFLFLVMVLIAVWFGSRFLGSFGSSVSFGVIWCALLAGGTEFAQSFLPLRNMSLLDFVADTAGIIYGCTVYALKIIEDRYDLTLWQI